MSRATLLAAVLCLTPAPAFAADKEESPSEKIRKALDQPIDLDLKETSLAKVVERFHEKTKLDISIDRAGGLGVDPNADMPQPVEASFKGTRVRDALRKVFEPYGVTPFIIDDAVQLTGEDIGLGKQLKQRVDVDVSDVPLGAAIKQLGRRKAVNLVVDQKAAKEAEKKVTLQVDDVALETAVRLLAEQAGMKAARIDNVLYVTTPDKAASIAADNRALAPAYPPYGIYGNATGLPGGVGVFGALGAFGLGGVAGLGGGGGILGGAVPPRVVPAPPVPREESKPAPADPPKPAGRAPSVGAADAPAASDHPARLKMWACEAGRSSAGARRSRRRSPSPEPV